MLPAVPNPYVFYFTWQCWIDCNIGVPFGIHIKPNMAPNAEPYIAPCSK